MTNIKLICAKVNKFTGELFPTKKEIASFADRLLNDYCKKFGRTIETVIYDEFVSKYIGVDIQYQRLSLNKSILGATIQKDGILETYNEDGTLKLINVLRGDIFVDPDACGSDSRELFTIFHELKHYLLDLDKDFRVDKIIDDETIINCNFKTNNKSQYSWAEFFANYFAACVLLSRRRLKKLYDEKHTKYVTEYHTSLNGQKIWILKKIIGEIADETGVSRSAIAIRLKETNLITEPTFYRPGYKYGKEAAMLFRYNNNGGGKK